MNLKKLASLALAGALTLGLLPALSSPALADGDTSTYTIDIPSALTVTKTGWNDQTAGIKASGTLADGKKLTVTATSPTNNFNLKSGDNSVAYKLAAESEKEKSYSDATAKTTWEFSKDDLAASGGKTETVGVILEDITNKPAGTYTDTVTFTASVASALTYIEVAKKYNRPYYMDNVRFYYIPGETYRQAVQNHGTENGSNWKFGEWSTTNHTIYYGGNGNGNLYIDGDDAFAPGRGSCELTLDSVVDPNRTYTHDIEIRN